MAAAYKIHEEEHQQLRHTTMMGGGLGHGIPEKPQERPLRNRQTYHRHHHFDTTPLLELQQQTTPNNTNTFLSFFNIDIYSIGFCMLLIGAALFCVMNEALLEHDDDDDLHTKDLEDHYSYHFIKSPVKQNRQRRRQQRNIQLFRGALFSLNKKNKKKWVKHNKDSMNNLLDAAALMEEQNNNSNNNNNNIIHTTTNNKPNITKQALTRRRTVGSSRLIVEPSVYTTTKTTTAPVSLSPNTINTTTKTNRSRSNSFIMMVGADNTELIIQEQIGSGGFGSVHAATWRGTPVAVKYSDSSFELEKEVELLSSLRHPNICLFMGVLLNKGFIMELVSGGSLWECLRRPLPKNILTMYGSSYFELCDLEGNTDLAHGSTYYNNLISTSQQQSSSTMMELSIVDVNNELQNNNSNHHSPSSSLSSFDRWPSALVLHIASGTARGMVYLHSLNILHQDLKSANILLDHTFTPKITDFGLSTTSEILLREQHNNNSQHIHQKKGTVQWMSPEILTDNIKQQQPCSEFSDVYSFGIVLWEMLTGLCPFHDVDLTNNITTYVNNVAADNSSSTSITQKQQQQQHGVEFNEMQLLANKIVHDNVRPNIPLFCSNSYRSLIEACWDRDPTKRPNFNNVLKTIDQFESVYC